MSQTTITDIGTVGIPVSDQDKAALAKAIVSSVTPTSPLRENRSTS